MKRTMLARRALLAGLVLAVAACEDGLTEANENPNAPTDVAAQFLLPQAIRAAVENTFDSWMLLSHANIFSQQGAQIQYPDEETGLVRPGNMTAFWQSYYATSGMDAQRIVEKGAADSQPRVQAVGMIWRTWIFSHVTDLWGDVPYSEALRAGEGKTQPAYDAQQQVYQGMLQSLKEAVALLDQGGVGNFGSGDILYDNNFARWRKFANSLRMRLAMRLSERDAAFARTEFTAANSAGPFTSNADNAMIRWPGAPYENPLYENWTGRDDHGISQLMVNTLKDLSDPRLELYAEPATVDGVFRGAPNGLAKLPNPLNHWSRIGRFWRQDGSATPTAIMTYSEVLFLQAEAAARGWITGTPATFYTQAITANMNQYDPWSPANNPTDAEITAYLAQPSVAYSNLNSIHLQKWISLYMNANEAWANVRRVDFPVLVKGPDLTTAVVPTRFSYPVEEQSLNGTNLAAAVQRQGGGNDLVTRVWWDVK